MEENKDKKENSGKLQLKKTFNVGQIKQSFSHGRTRSVAVEIKKKRILRSPKDEEQNEEKEEKIIKDETKNLQESNGDIKSKDELNHQRKKKTDSSRSNKRVNESKDTKLCVLQVINYFYNLFKLLQRTV